MNRANDTKDMYGVSGDDTDVSVNGSRSGGQGRGREGSRSDISASDSGQGSKDNPCPKSTDSPGPFEEIDVIMRGKSTIVGRSGRIGVLTLDPPEGSSAFSVPSLLELGNALDAVSGNPEIFCLIIKAAEKVALYPGTDVPYLLEQDESGAHMYSQLGQAVAHKLERSVPPAIMICRGEVAGGALELALACDFRMASDGAMFSLPHINLGIIPGWGGTQRLIRTVGTTRAHELVMTGRRLTAEQALDIGLLNAVAHKDDLDRTVWGLATGLSEKGRMALLAAKRSLKATNTLALDDGDEYESGQWATLFRTRDGREAMRAFIEKSKPGSGG